MKFGIDIIQTGEYLQILLSGNYDLQKAIDYFTWLLNVCRSTRKNYVLIDFRSLKGEITTSENFIYATMVTKHYNNYILTGGKPLRLAYLGKATQVGILEPGVQLAKQNNIPVMLTTDLNEAINWLKIRT